MRLPKYHAKGFTLAELAIVLVIVALLIGGLLIPLSTQKDVSSLKETQATLNEAREALLGFAMVNGYLPCPAPVDFSTNGAEGPRTGDTCNDTQGFLPWQTLGIGRFDAWSHHLRYSVTPAFSRTGTNKFTLSSVGTITVNTRNQAGNVTPLATQVPAVIMSFGKSAHWAYGETGVQTGDTSATNVDEDVNGSTGAGTTFFSRNQTSDTGTTGGEFDDQVVWLPTNLLFNRMITAGKLP